jgi:signal transduction histidine kinase/CheY-like chemotaxis protein/HPt (histidine-containing phosphotransfer) domain-containing protein
MKKKLLIILLLIISFQGPAQRFQKINTLESLLNSETDLKKLVTVFYELSMLYESSNPEKAMENALRSLTISKSLQDNVGIVNAYNQIGLLELNFAHYQAALDAHYSALKNNEQAKDLKGISLSNLFIGQVYQEKGGFELAEDFYLASLEIAKEINCSLCLSKGNSRLGDLSYVQGKDNLSLQYYLVALEAISLTNNIEELAEVNRSVGFLYKNAKRNERALEHYLKSLSDFERIDDKEKQSILCFEIGLIYQAENEFDLALLYMKTSLGLAEKTGLKAYIKKGYENLANVYEKNENHKLAYEYLKYYLAIKDTREISELEAQLDIENKNQEIQLLNKEKQFKAQELNTKNFVTNIILLVCFVVIILALFLFFALKQKNKINLQLQLANEDANRSRTDKEEFFAYTSHEIRTPLNAVVGMSRLLGETDLNPGQQKYLRTINSSAQNILFLVNDVLDLSKIESGTIELENVDFSIQEIVTDLINSLDFKLREKNVSLISRLDRSIPIVLMGDPHRINQIVLNLVDNAIKFTSDGEVCIAISVTHETEKSIALLFEISDTGIGIRKSRLDTIFDSFKQETTQTTRQYGGTGLGLAITKNLIQLMNSKVHLESTYGEGSRFSFELELKKSKNKTLNVGILNNSAKPLRDIKILVVDDNALNQEIFFDLINNYKNNVEVEMADDGKMALLKVKQSNYDIILMDIQMPIMDGYEATRQIRKLKGSKASTPIIAMTAHVLDGVAEKCDEAGMSDYISKPINLAILNQIIKKHIKESPVNDSVILGGQTNEDIVFDTTHVHLEELLQLVNNDYSKLEKYISIFFNNVPSDLESLKEAVVSQKWEELGKIAHKIKGNVGYMGIASIKKDLQILEKVNKEVGDLEEIADIVNRVEIVLELAIKELKEIKGELKEKA